MVAMETSAKVVGTLARLRLAAPGPFRMNAKGSLKSPAKRALYSSEANMYWNEKVGAADLNWKVRVTASAVAPERSALPAVSNSEEAIRSFSWPTELGISPVERMTPLAKGMPL